METAARVQKADPADPIALAVWTAPERERGRRWRLGLGTLRQRWWEQLAGAGDVALAAIVGEDSVVADAHQTRRQDVPTEATDKFARAQAKGLHGRTMPVIAPGEAEGLRVAVQGEQATVTQGDAVGVVGQISQKLFRSAKGSFGIDVPALLVKLAQAVPQGGGHFPGSVGEVQGLGAMEQGLEGGEEFAAKQRGEGANRKEEFPLLGRGEALAVGAEGAPGDDAMEVGMEVELLAPGVENGADPQLAAQPLTTELEQALAGAVEEQRIEPERGQSQTLTQWERRLILASAAQACETNIRERMYQVINHGDRREPIFKDGADRKLFLTTLGECCGKTNWQVAGGASCVRFGG